MVKITFPDGVVHEYEQGVTGLQIAESISPALARDVVSCGVNGETVELNRPILEDADFVLYKFEDEEGKHTFWHTSAHLLAEALQELYPGIQFGFGPAVENGFFYDVMPPKGVTISENDFPAIEAKMKELAKKDEPVVRKDVTKADALAEFNADGQTYKCEHIDQDLEDGTISTYTQGAFTDLCRGPHLVSTGAIKAIKLTSVAGAFWRGDAKREKVDDARMKIDLASLKCHLNGVRDLGQVKINNFVVSLFYMIHKSRPPVMHLHCIFAVSAISIPQMKRLVNVQKAQPS